MSRIIGLSIISGLASTSVATAASCSYQETCVAGGIEGVCVSVSAGCCSGTVTAGLCSGSSDIKCCTENKCSTPFGEGKCLSTSACSGQHYSGYCTGPSDIQCCVEGGGDDTEYGSNPYYYDHWCAAETYALPYLDDKYCQKKFPTKADREWTCPVSFDASQSMAAGYVADTELSNIKVDVSTLASIVDPADANICAILTRRSAEGVLYNK
jgi:hypothetical protein